MTSVTSAVFSRREPELAGQTVVLIGGSAGIGLETARHARHEGADVIIAGRNPDRLEHAAQDRRATHRHLRRHQHRLRRDVRQRSVRHRSTM